MARTDAQEVSLQSSLDRVTETLLDPTRDGADREAAAQELGLEQAMAYELDGRQRERLSTFLSETGLINESVRFPDSTSPEIREPARIQVSRRAARVVTVVLFIASFGFLLTGIAIGPMIMVFDPMEILMERKTTSGEILNAVFLWLVLSTAAAVSGAGFWWLFRHEQRSRENDRKALEASRETSLQSSLRGIGRILEQGPADPRAQRLLRARVLSALPALDGEQKRRLLEFLYTSGCLGGKIRLDLSGADFASARLSDIQMEDVSLSGIDLGAADLRRAELTRVDLSRCNLGGCDLRGAQLHACDLRQSNLSQARLRSAHLAGCDLGVAHVTAEQLRTTASLEGSALPGGRPYAESLPAPSSEPEEFHATA